MALLTGDCASDVADEFNCELLISKWGLALVGGRRGIGLRTETADDYGCQIPGAGLGELVGVEGCC